MNKLISLVYKQFYELKNVLERFTVPFYLSILIFISLSYVIISSNTNRLLLEVCGTLALGFVTCTLSQVLYEKIFENKFDRFKLKYSKLIYDVFWLLISLLSFPIMHFYSKLYLLFIGFTGVIICEWLLILFFSENGSISRSFSHLIKGISFNTTVCTIFYLGMCVCLFALNNLVLNFRYKNFYKSFLILGVFVCLIYQIMRLSIIPSKHKKLESLSKFNIITSNLVLTIYLSLLFILYLYLGRIILTRTFPSNEVNLFVSISSLLFVFLSFSLMCRKGENKFIDSFLKFSGILVIPTIIMQFVSIYIRVSEYGLTSIRYLSIVLNLFALIFAILILIRQEKGLRESIIVLSVMSILVTVTPLNIVDVPMMNQKIRFKNFLLKNGMLENGHIIKKSPKEISELQRDKIIETYLYLKNNYHQSNIKLDFLEDDIFTDGNVKKIFGFTATNPYTAKVTLTSNSVPVGFSYHHSLPLDIDGYNKIYRLMYDQLYIKNHEVLFKLEGKVYTIDGFYNYLKDTYIKLKDQKSSNIKIEYTFNDYKFIILNGSLSLNNDDNNSMGDLDLSISEGYVLKK